MTLVFNGNSPVQAILTGSPRDARERLNADLGLYAQDQWTLDRFTFNLQHQLVPRVSVGFGYFYRKFGNYTHTDALQVGPSDYTPYCIFAPVDDRLPNSGEPVCGLFDPTPSARPLLSIDRIVDHADSQTRNQTFNGFDYTTTARWRDKLLLGGGASTVQTHNVNCEIFDSPDLRFCETTTPWLTQVKLLASYSLPYSLRVSGTFQSIPGPALEARWSSVTNAIANAGPAPLGRNLSAGRSTTRDGSYVSLTQQNSIYGERLNQLDLRVARTFRWSGNYRLQVMLDIYNSLNNSAVIAYNNTYGPE
jgi:hypothetical protein